MTKKYCVHPRYRPVEVVYPHTSFKRDLYCARTCQECGEDISSLLLVRQTDSTLKARMDALMNMMVDK